MTLAELANTRGWALYCAAEVLYDGRAASTLKNGNYLVLHKSDGSLSVHGGTQVPPRNYMTGPATCIVKENIISFTRKKETISITVQSIHSIQLLPDMSDHKPEMIRTERDLVNSIVANWPVLFGHGYTISTEFTTNVGNIDILGDNSTELCVVEVKRKRARLDDVSQLHRYVQVLQGMRPDRIVRGYLASPSIISTSLRLLESYSMTWLEIGFDPAENNKRWPDWR